MIIGLSLLLGLALSISIGVKVLARWRARHRGSLSNYRLAAASPALRACFLLWPGCWLVIKSRNLFTVQLALGLHNPKPCSWLEGLAGEEQLFVAPPVKGWILVTGTGLPDPCEDADACFRFVLELSRKVGKVQFFCANRSLHHHAWISARDGRVVRAYVWAGQTLWNQGPQTREEKELGLTCYAYAEPAQVNASGQAQGVEANVDKVPLLAARWSFDPARIYEHLLQKECGIAGEPARWF